MGKSGGESVCEWGRQEGRVCVNGEGRRGECACMEKAGGESVCEWGRQEGRVCVNGEGRRGECV